MAKSLFIASGSQSAINAGVTSYSTIQGSNVSDSTESTRQIAIRPAGTFSNLRAYILYNTLSASSTIRFRKNTANGNQSITVGSGATGYFTDASAGTDTVAAGDVVDYQVVAGGTGTSMTFSQLSTVFTPTSSTITSTMYGNINMSDIAFANTTYYIALQSYSTAASSTESTAQCYVRIAGSLKYLQARVSANARTTTTTFRSRKNTANGAQSFTVGSGATGLFQDTTNSDAVESGDLINMSWTTGTGTEALTTTAVAMSLETSTKESMYCCWQQNGVSTSPGGTYKMPIHSKLTSNSATTYVAKADFDGSFHKIGYLVMENTHTTASTGKIAINGTESTELAATITAGTTGWFNDLTGTEVMSSGDTISFLLIIGTGGDAAIRGAYVHFTQLDSLNDPVNTFVTRFKKDNSGTADVTQDVILPFTPKAIIVYSDGNSVDNTASAHYQWIQGFSDGTNHACTTIRSMDGRATDSLASLNHSNTVTFQRMNETATGILSAATCTFGTNKVTFTWTTNDTAATYIHMVAYGGDDITNAKVNTVSGGRSTVGTYNYTGLGFNPTDNNAVLFLFSSEIVSLNTNTTNGELSFGCAVSPSKRWVVSNAMENAQNPSDTFRIYSNDNVLSAIDSTTGALVMQADFNAWITDGFQLDWTTVPLSTNRKMSYLVIKGGTWDAGTSLTPSTPTNDLDYSVSVYSQPIRGLLIASTEAYSGNINSVAIIGKVGIGTTDGTTQTSIGVSDADNVSTTESYRINTTSNIFKIINPGPWLYGYASFDSFGTNSFRLDFYEEQTSSAIYFGWVVVADYEEPPIPDFYAQISEPLVKYYNSIYVRKFLA